MTTKTTLTGMVLAVLINALVGGAAVPAGAENAPYEHGDTSSSTYESDVFGTAEAEADGNVDLTTGDLSTAAAARSTFPVGCLQTACVSDARADSKAFVQTTRVLPGGDYVVVVKFTDAARTSAAERQLLNGVPYGSTVEYAHAFATVRLSTSCGGCSAVSRTEFVYLNSQARTVRFVQAITVPDGAEVEVTSYATLRSYAYARGSATASTEAAATVDELSILRAEEFFS